MSDEAAGAVPITLAQRLRRRFAAWRRLPIHPQWFVSGDQARREEYLHELSGDVLDVGCSDKSLAALLPDDCRYFGLDHYQTVSAFYGTRPDIFGDACRLPLRDACMDGVLLFEVLEHVPDPDGAIAEIARVLRPGGRLLLSVPFMYPIHNAPFDFQRFTSHGLQLLLHNHGFQIALLAPRLRPLEVAGLIASMALGDAAMGIWSRHRWACPLLVPIALCVLLGNLGAWGLARVLPRSDFMPGGYGLVAVRRA